MGLAASQARLLALTARKHDCELGEQFNALRKMSLTRESSELEREYFSKLKAKDVAYYADGKYNRINYNYIMGGCDYSQILQNSSHLKKNNSMILCDYKGQVVLNTEYANAITAVCPDAVASDGSGKTFSTSNIAAMIAKLTYLDEKYIKTVMDGGNIEQTYPADKINLLTNTTVGTTTRDNSDTATAQIQKLIDFYEPIFKAAATNGWTTEYYDVMRNNPDYVNDSLNSGTFQLVSVQSDGNYDPNTSLEYFVLHNNEIDKRTSSEDREEITAWYNAEKEIISVKETALDLEMNELSTEIEAINEEINSINSLIQDAISSVFDWGSS